MFMTNYELVYGKRKFSSNASNPPAPAEYNSTPVIQSEECDSIESSEKRFMKSAVGFIKSDDTKQKLGSLAGKIKNAAGVTAGAASGFAKSAIDTAKSEETSAKIASLMEKAQSAAGGIGASVSGLSSKASEAISSRKHSVSNEIDFSETDITHTEEYSENTIQEETVYADDDSETVSQEYYVSDDEYEADEYIEEYEGASDETEEEIHVYNESPQDVHYSQTVYTRTHGNYSNMYEQADYTNSQEKSNKNPVVIGIAAGLGICAVFAGGLFGGMYLMKNKNDTPDNDKVIAGSTTEALTAERPTEKVTEKATINESQTETSTKENIENTTVLPKPTATAYIEEVSFYPMGDGSSFILHVDGDYSYYYFEGYYTGGGEYDSMCAYGETSNQTVELTVGSVMSEVRAVVIPYNSDKVAGDKIYASIKPQYSSSSSISSDDPYYAIKQEIMHSVDNEYYSGKNSHIENAPSDMVFYAKDNRSNIEIANPTVFSGPGVNYFLIDVYTSNFYIVGENRSWYYVMWVDGMGAFSHACYGYIKKSDISQKKEYNAEEIRNAAGPDFSFYADFGPPASYGRTVNTESDPLNLRAAPSINADIITQIPKGAVVGEFGFNGEWSYIAYVDENGTHYNGYVSSQYLY